MIDIPDKIQPTMDVTKIGVTKFVFVDLFQLKIQLKILYQKNALKMIVMIIEDNKIIQFLVQLARTGKLNPHKVMIEPRKITQILVLVTIITAETLMEHLVLGVIRLTQIWDGSYVIHTLKNQYQKNALKMIVMIIEDNKIIQFLVQLARTGKLNPHKIMIEPKKITQILVLVTIITAETLMEQVDLGVIRLTQIWDGSYVIH